MIADAARAATVGELYRESGYDVHVPETPLDAIHTLVSAGDRIRAIVLQPDARAASGMREFLVDEYPEIERIELAA